MNLSELYSNIYHKQPASSCRKLAKDLYQLVYEKTDPLPGFEDADGDEDARYGVFFINQNNITQEMVQMMSQAGAEGPVFIPVDYFTGIERRFRGKSIESLSQKWLANSSKDGKVDNISYQSLLNKVFAYDLKVKGDDLSEFREFVEWCDPNQETDRDIPIEDVVHQALASEQVNSINFLELLEPLVSYFVFSNTKDFIFSLWAIVEQSTNVNIGRGEYAIALLSRGYKGEPGDVKFNEMGGLPALEIEVKGKGGRPGKGNHTHGITEHINNVIGSEVAFDDPSIDNMQQLMYGSSLNSRYEAIETYLNTTFRNKLPGNAAAFKGGDYITTFLANLKKIVFKSGTTNVKTLVNQIETELEHLQSWITSLSSQFGKSFVINAKTIGMLTEKGESGIAFYAAGRNNLRSSGNILSSGLSWQMVVRLFFCHIAKVLELEPEVIAKALCETRSDTLEPGQAEELEQSILELINTQGIETVYDQVSVGKLICAIQFTSYCVADGFNRALFINDQTLNARNVPTRPSDINFTLNQLFNEFMTNEYTVNAAIDKRNKGVQLNYNG